MNIRNQLAFGGGKAMGNTSLQFDGVNDIAIVPYDSIIDEPQLLLNNSFESHTGTKDDSTTDTFTSWTNINAGVGTRLAVTGLSGGVAARLVNITTNTGGVKQSIAVEPLVDYIFTAKYRGTGIGRYAIYDNTNAASITAFTGMGTTDPVIWTTFTRTITIPAGCISISIQLLGPSAASFCDFDEVRVSKAYSFSLAFFVKRNIPSLNIDRDYIISRLWTDEAAQNYARNWSGRFMGDEAAEADQGKFRFSVSKEGNSSTLGVSSNTVLQPYTWYHIVASCEYLGSGQSRLKIHLNSISDGESTGDGYPFNGAVNMTFGALEAPTRQHFSACNISKIQYAKRIFTEQEVYNASRGKTLDNLISYWNGSEFVGGEWLDIINNQNAVVSGAVIVAN